MNRCSFRAALLLATAAPVLALAGCYSFRDAVPSHIKSIAVPVFRNETLQSGIEEDVTRQVIDRFQRDNSLAIAEVNDADAVLEGTLTGYDNRVYRFNDAEQAEEYIVVLTLDITVKDRVKNKDMWQQEGMRTTATYLLSGDQARTETEARQEAIEQLSDVILSRTVAGW
jgi:hypothetical protein